MNKLMDSSPTIFSNYQRKSYFTGPKIDVPDFTTLNRKEDMDTLLAFAVRQNASDIFLQSGRPVVCDIYGQFHSLTKFDLSITNMQQLFRWMTDSDSTISRLESGTDVDGSFEVRDPLVIDEESGEAIHYRFRLNITAGQAQRGSNGYQAVLRSIPINPPTIDDIGYPRELLEYSAPEQGSMLISGETGSGKTTTFAALIRYILEGNTSIKGNVLTYEKPIEYVYGRVSSPCCLVQQHEIGRHIPSFADGVRNSLRRKPGLLVIGELRDQETMEAAIEASNTGHPVFSTVHANSVTIIFKRMMNRFHVDLQRQAFSDLLDTTRLLMSQTLVPRLDKPGRICLREWIVLTDVVRERIAESGPLNHVSEMRSIIEEDRLHKSMKASTLEALEQGIISRETASGVIKRFMALRGSEVEDVLRSN